MKLGLLTAAFPDLTLEEVASWAGANFRSQEGAGSVAAKEAAAVAIQRHWAWRAR